MTNRTIGVVKRTLTMSEGSKVGIGLPVGVRSPLVKGRKRVVDCSASGLCQDDVVAIDAIEKFAPLPEMQGCTYRRGIVVCDLLVNLPVVTLAPLSSPRKH